MKRQSMDGCLAATYIAYAFSDIATIYPITPVAEMGEVADKWGTQGLHNLMGTTMQVKEMESELGAAGASHGALAGGALATTFTASQGLMLMIPNMYKIAGELLPAVFHVGCRSLATHALSIFGDHQDVMACRATGFSILASASVQETHDLAIVAHLAAINGSVPVLHMFDGWRTSNEIATIDVASFEELQPLLPTEEIAKFRARSMNPEHPNLRGSAQNWDVYFQNTEARNKYYDVFPDIVQDAMNKVWALTGRKYHLFDYYGAEDAEDIIISIGSSAEVVKYTVDHLNKNGGKYGMIQVRLYRPFKADALLAAIPSSVKRIAVLDRTKEAGSLGEPLYLDVAATVQTSGRDIKVIGGRYGLSSKAFDPSMVKAVFDNLVSENPITSFSVGIVDDVTHRSLQIKDKLLISSPGTTSALFYGIGSDGTVGATKTGARIISEKANLYSQAYFEYSAKKSGGFTISQLRFGPTPVAQAYSIEQADYVACNKSMYVRRFELVDCLVDGGTFVLNSSWSLADMETRLPASFRRAIASKKVKFYNLDALKIAEANNLGVRINMIMLAAFFKLRQIIPYEDALAGLKDYITKLYMHEGGDVVKNNIAALDAVAAAITEINYPETWINAADNTDTTVNLPEFIAKVAKPCMHLEGDKLPVSAFTPDGTMPMGTTAYEKRTIADYLPDWNPSKCIECTQCSFVCSHATIRPFLLDTKEKAGAPEALVTKSAFAKPLQGLQFRIQIYPEDCTGCGSCAVVCPGHALTMVPLGQLLEKEIPLLDYIQKNVSIKDNLLKRDSVNGSQFHEPLMQFSGACGGCGETPYVKLLTQLLGERMVIANATGCSSIWGANYPSNAYCVNRHGLGPAWGNSLFEDNAEYGYGIASAIAQRREHLTDLVKAAVANASTKDDVKAALNVWLNARTDGESSKAASAEAIKVLKSNTDTPGYAEMLSLSDLFVKKSVWAIGGDGWAYDIGFAGLDHVLAQNVDINILVMDTECYSNTGGQTSKATPLGAVAKYSADGKRTYKKDLGRMMMTYPEVYVASIAIGANFQQAINAIVEADAHPGPSIVIAYCPCINHGIRTGMSHTIIEEREAVKTGYWQLYRKNPAKSPALTIDNPAPDGNLIPFINGEDRYADLKMVDAAAANILQPELEARCDSIYDILTYNSKYVATK